MADSSKVVVDFIVKLGGSAITVKDETESLKFDALCGAADVLAQCFAKGLRFIVAHGAGSFGHVDAREYCVSSGYVSQSADVQSHIKYGFSVVRQSVTKLNHKVVEVLVCRGLPAVSCSPCGIWTNDNGRVVRDGCNHVETLLAEGFIPVLHGDCVLDDSIGCSILSSDSILQVFCAKLSIPRAIFVMDCAGVYTIDPNLAGATLLPVLSVNQHGCVSTTFEASVSKNDITGGIEFKLNSATDIVLKSRGNTKVLMCSVTNSRAFLDACLYGTWRCATSEGTIVQYTCYEESSLLV